MKRRNLIKKLESAGFVFKEHGGNHDTYKRGNDTEQVPRHTEIMVTKYCLRVVFREVFCHEYGKIPRHTGQNAITEGDVECILTQLL